MKSTRNSFSDNYNKPFPTALRKIMESTGKTQKDISEFIGKKTQSVSQYVNGQSEPGYETLVKIADFFDCSVDYLLGRTDDHSRKPSAADELELSPMAIEWIKGIGTSSKYSHCRGNVEVLNYLLSLENVAFEQFFANLCEYFYALRAESIIGTMYNFAFPDGYPGETDAACDQNEKIFDSIVSDLINKGIFPDRSSIYLSAINDRRQSLQYEYEGSKFLYAALHGSEYIRLSDMRAASVTRYCSKLIDYIEELVKAEHYEELYPECALNVIWSEKMADNEKNSEKTGIPST